MNLTKKLFAAVMSLALVLLPATAGATTLTSTVATVNLSATANESVTVSVDTPNVTLGATPVAASLHYTTGWNLNPSLHPNLDTAVYFTSANALTSGTNVITTAQIDCINNGTAQSTFTAAQSVGGVALTFTCPGDFSILTSTQPSGQATVPLAMWIPSLNSSVVPGNYTGTLSIQVFAF